MLIFALLCLLQVHGLELQLTENNKHGPFPRSEEDRSSIYLIGLDKDLYRIDKLRVQFENGTFVNLIFGRSLISTSLIVNLLEVQRLDVEITFFTGWMGQLRVNIAGQTESNGTMVDLMTYYQVTIGPVLNEQIDESETSYQNASEMLYDLDSTSGIIMAILRSFRPISNILFPHCWPLVLILMTGTSILPQNLYYFLGIVTSLNVRYQVMNWSLTFCNECTPNIQQRSMFYLFSLGDDSMVSEWFLSPNYTANQFYNFDWTLLFIFFCLAMLIVGALTKKEVPIWVSIAFLDGCVIEITVLSFTKFYQVIDKELGGVDLFLGIMGFISCFLMLLYCLRPIYYCFRLKSLQTISTTHQPARNSTQRRATGYPGKIALPTTLYMSPFYNRIMRASLPHKNLTLMQQSYLIENSIHLLSGMALALTLPLVSEAKDYYAMAVAQQSLSILITFWVYFSTCGHKNLNPNVPFLMLLFQFLSQGLLLTVYVLLYSNEYLVSETLNKFMFANEAYDGTGKELLPLQRQELTSEIENLNKFGQLELYLIISYISVHAIQQFFRLWMTLRFVVKPIDTSSTVELQRLNEEQQHPLYVKEEGKVEPSELYMNNQRPPPPPNPQPQGQLHSDVQTLKQSQHQQQQSQHNQLQNQQQIQNQQQNQPQNQQNNLQQSHFQQPQQNQQKPNFNHQQTAEPFRLSSQHEQPQHSYVSSEMGLQNYISPYLTGQIVHDSHGKVLVPKKASLEYSRLFNEGTIKFAKSELVCTYSFTKEVVIGGVPIGPEHTKFIKKINPSNVKMFMNDMRVAGKHRLRFQNINKVNSIALVKLYIKVLQEGRVIKKEMKVRDMELKPGDFFDIEQPCSFDYVSSELSNDRIELKGVYVLQVPESPQKIIKLELCNSELRLIQIAAYTNKSLAKLQNASKEVHPIKNRKYFALVFEDKILQFTPKKVHSFVHHHQLLQFHMETDQTNQSGMELVAYFGKMGLVIANSPFIQFHLIIETLMPSNDSVKSNEAYILLSIFIKKSCKSLTNGHKSVAEQYCRHLIDFFR